MSKHQFVSANIIHKTTIIRKSPNIIKNHNNFTYVELTYLSIPTPPTHQA